MAVAIAINIAVGSITFALRLPIYLDSIGTVLVGVARRAVGRRPDRAALEPHLVDPADARRRRARRPRSSRPSRR